MPELIHPSSELPEIKPAQLSKLLIVSAAEFGQKPVLCFARAWKSTAPGQSVKWYVDPSSYGLDHPIELMAEVTGWMYAPEPIGYKPVYQMMLEMTNA